MSGKGSNTYQIMYILQLDGQNMILSLNLTEIIDIKKISSFMNIGNKTKCKMDNDVFSMQQICKPPQKLLI